MKKNEEGYTLPFVLVVMIVLCLVASGLLAGALRNLQSQQAVIERMQDQYEAQGAIEIVVAQLEKEQQIAECSVEAINHKLEQICNSVYGGGSANNPDTVPETDASKTITAGEEFSYTFKLTSQYDTVQIICTIEMKITVKTEGDDLAGYTHTMNASEVTYTSYTITNLPEGGGA